MLFDALLTLAAILAGAVAAVAGFGIGSILTPLLAVQTGAKLAVAAVSIPHLIATALRLWMLRAQVDRRLLWSFGVMSAAGGLTGALLHAWASSPALAVVLGGLLVFAGLTGLTGLAPRMRFRGWAAWLAGGLSGLLGGLVGNQGGIRAAALLGFEVQKTAFVATATAIALVVDAARMPVYFATQARAMAALWPAILLTSAGVVAGTFLGVGSLRRVPEPIFRRIVSSIILALGLFMLWQVWRR